jgi:hypothetical protein
MRYDTGLPFHTCIWRKEARDGEPRSVMALGLPDAGTVPAQDGNHVATLLWKASGNVHAHIRAAVVGGPGPVFGSGLRGPVTPAVCAAQLQRDQGFVA